MATKIPDVTHEVQNDVDKIIDGMKRARTKKKTDETTEPVVKEKKTRKKADGTTTTRKRTTKPKAEPVVYNINGMNMDEFCDMLFAKLSEQFVSKAEVEMLIVHVLKDLVQSPAAVASLLSDKPAVKDTSNKPEITE